MKSTAPYLLQNWRGLLSRLAATAFAATVAVAACYLIVSYPCTRAGTLAGVEQNPSDGCSDQFFWNSNSNHRRAYQLSTSGYGQPQTGKTNYIHRTQQYLGTWQHDYWYPFPWGGCYFSHSANETKTWTCDDDILDPDAPDCQGYYP
ncbi:MAG: hypothetical protein FJ387_24320 [Verrucomicrobia bacterium]|nr:hypothetical protein [Verrucomicrobiota bacterium]